MTNIIKVTVPMAFTLKARKRANCSQEFYVGVLSVWRKLNGVNIKHVSYETDKQSRLHVHGLIHVPPQFKWRQLKSTQTTTRFDLLPTKLDCLNWIAYCDKYQDDLMDTNDPVPKYSLFKRD